MPQDGAHPVTDVNDILESLNLHMLPQQAEAQILLPANDEERTLLKLLSSDPQHIDDLTRFVNEDTVVNFKKLFWDPAKELF